MSEYKIGPFRQGRVLVAILNHEPTPHQRDDIYMMGYDYLVALKHPPIPPEWDLGEVQEFFGSYMEETVAPEVMKVKRKEGRPYSIPDAFWVQGDYRFFLCACEEAKTFRIPLFVSTTERVAIDQVQADGSIVKTSVFKHVKFVKVQ